MRAEIKTKISGSLLLNVWLPPELSRELETLTYLTGEDNRAALLRFLIHQAYLQRNDIPFELVIGFEK